MALYWKLNVPNVASLVFFYEKKTTFFLVTYISEIQNIVFFLLKSFVLRRIKIENIKVFFCTVYSKIYIKNPEMRHTVSNLKQVIQLFGSEWDYLKNILGRIKDLFFMRPFFWKFKYIWNNYTHTLLNHKVIKLWNYQVC